MLHFCYYIVTFLKLWFDSVRKKNMRAARISGLVAQRPPYSIYQEYQDDPQSFARVLGVIVKIESVMILPQVHLRKPCYDFYFL